MWVKGRWAQGSLVLICNDSINWWIMTICTVFEWALFSIQSLDRSLTLPGWYLAAVSRLLRCVFNQTDWLYRKSIALGVFWWCRMFLFLVLSLSLSYFVCLSARVTLTAFMNNTGWIWILYRDWKQKRCKRTPNSKHILFTLNLSIDAPRTKAIEVKYTVIHFTR